MSLAEGPVRTWSAGARVGSGEFSGSSVSKDVVGVLAAWARRCRWASAAEPGFGLGRDLAAELVVGRACDGIVGVCGVSGATC